MHLHSNTESLTSKDSSFTGSATDRSNKSCHSYDTAPTDYSSSLRPPLAHHDTCGGRLEYPRDLSYTRYERQYDRVIGSQSSIETYASTIDVDDQYTQDEVDSQLPHPRIVETYTTEALPATPADFAELFPSTRQLSIKHDDTTDDGNMNLRLDTAVNIAQGRYRDVTLFHLRMHDLKRRDFSLRRYCRDSGREVCHTVRKYEQSNAASRPGLGRSLSHALAAIRSMSDGKSTNMSKLKRSDSGYSSITSRQSLEMERASTLYHDPKSTIHGPVPTNTTRLEFSNYSQVEVKRRGTKQNKRYEFEYWGNSYTWKRVVTKDTIPVQVLYHLYRANSAQILARIEPDFLTAEEEFQERWKGGWIPPSSMWIDDQQIIQNQNETSDVIVASGLIALVDDCIERRFHATPKRQFVIPVPKLRLDVDYIGTKDLFKEMMHRPTSRQEASSRRPPALRHVTYDI